MKKNMPRILFILIIISMSIECDQSTKFLAGKYLKNTETIHVIDNYFILHYAENNGTFLSIFSNFSKTSRIILLLLVPSIALLLMSYYLIYNKKLSRLHVFSLSSILGGGISNVMVDRVFNNQNVIDFMNIGIGAKEKHGRKI